MEKAESSILTAEATAHATFNKNQTTEQLRQSGSLLDQQVAKKLEDKFSGPFKVVEKMFYSNRLDIPKGIKGVYSILH